MIEYIHVLEQNLYEKQKEIGSFGEPFFLSENGTLPQINQALQLYNIPYIGSYSNGYPMGWPMMLLKMKLNPALLPAEMQTLDSWTQAELYVQIIDTGLLSRKKTLNLVVHPWVFPKLLPGQSGNVIVEMGIFNKDCTGIKPADKNNIAFNRIQPESVIPHPSGKAMCCSPNNARFSYSPELPVNDFWTFCRHGKRVVVCYMILINDPMLAEKMRQLLHISDNLNAAMTHFEENSIERIVPLIKQLQACHQRVTSR